MRFVLLSLLFFYTIFLPAQTVPFCILLKKAEKGDYVVFRSGSLLHMVRVLDNQDNQLTLEEMTAPYSEFTKNTVRNSYNTLKAKAIDHLLLKVDILQPNEYEAYSIKEKAAVAIDEKNSFFLELLSKDLEIVPEHERKRVGIKPKIGPDRRKIFTPLLAIEGEKKEIAEFNVYKLLRPSSIPLKDKKIFLYFPKNFFLPYWIEVRGQSKSLLRLGGIDSGKNFLENMPSFISARPCLTARVFQSETTLHIPLFIPTFQKFLKITDQNHSVLPKKEYELQMHTKNYYTLKISLKNVKDSTIQLHFQDELVITISIEK